MSVRVDNKLPQFARNLGDKLNDAMRESATNILVASKQRAPFDKGGLRSDTDTKQVGRLHWRVSYWKEYARFQEFGGDGRRVVRNYTTGGTGKKFLSTAGNNEVGNLQNRLRAFGNRAKV